MSALRIRIVVDRGLFLDLDGALTASTARRLDRVIDEFFLGDEPPPHLAVDLVRLTFLDEEGLGALVRTSELASEAGASFVLRQPRRHVERLLQIVGLGPLVRTDPALAPIRRPQAAGARLSGS